MATKISLPALRAAIGHLKAGREVLAAPTVWIKGVYARGASDAVRAPQVCSLGALGKVANLYDYNTGKSKIAAAIHFLGCALSKNNAHIKDIFSFSIGKGETAIVAFNDDKTTTHADVLAGWDLAIELAENTLNSIPDETDGG